MIIILTNIISCTFQNLLLCNVSDVYDKKVIHTLHTCNTCHTCTTCHAC